MLRKLPSSEPQGTDGREGVGASGGEDIALGVSPRGTVALYRAVQALAFLEGRDYVIPDDVKALAPNVLAHRLIPSGGHQASALLARLLDTVAIP